MGGKAECKDDLQAEDDTGKGHPYNRDCSDDSRVAAEVPGAFAEAVVPDQAAADGDGISNVRPENGKGENGTIHKHLP